MNEAARRSRQTRFTALLHHVDDEALLRAFRRQRRAASAGVDGVTVASYEQNLEENIRDLCERVHTGRYRPQPVRRTYIPKADGGRRPLGIPTLEDKIVQGAVAEVLSAIYEVDFLGFSYGFRPGRNPHQALDALQTALMAERINWVLDADIRSFFDSVDHEWLLRMLAHRVADRRVLRLVRQWLRAGVLDGGTWQANDEGTPQGAGISPLLSNIFLHYTLDLWVQKRRRQEARGRVIVVRYADDFVMGFEHESDAHRMIAALKERLAGFGLALHEDKTRLLMFGRFATERRAERGLGRPETFDFLGFTHYCDKSRNGRFIVRRRTQRNRMIRKLKELRLEMRRRMHIPVTDQWRWLSAVLRGHYGYYGLTGNYRAMKRFLQEVEVLWQRALARRSQKARMFAPRFLRLLRRLPLPEPSIIEPYQAIPGG
ncbi:MAG: group II intron reverse transcriptase/maturase [Aliidongia sp.]